MYLNLQHKKKQIQCVQYAPLLTVSCCELPSQSKTRVNLIYKLFKQMIEGADFNNCRCPSNYLDQLLMCIKKKSFAVSIFGQCNTKLVAFFNKLNRRIALMRTCVASRICIIDTVKEHCRHLCQLNCLSASMVSHVN